MAPRPPIPLSGGVSKAFAKDFGTTRSMIVMVRGLGEQDRGLRHAGTSSLLAKEPEELSLSHCGSKENHRP